ncbi:MAG: thioredoxin family protein [Balneolaceae bacterium]|nr:thioredoxin family protein [Balneolaceae bacterium]
MKRLIIYCTVVALAIVGLLALAPFKENLREELKIGAKAPMLETPVKDVSGKMITMKEVAGENGLLVNFSCNTCPWVKRWEDRYNPIAELARENGIGVIALNPNTASRERGDSFEDMQQRAEQSNYSFYYALDEQSKIAEAFGASRTPHIYLFNSDMELVYRGAIDDNARSAAEVEKPYLKNAIQELAAGKEITTKTSKSLGCTIKWPESE